MCSSGSWPANGKHQALSVLLSCQRWIACTQLPSTFAITRSALVSNRSCELLRSHFVC
jgi:hypothetical protein